MNVAGRGGNGDSEERQNPHDSYEVVIFLQKPGILHVRQRTGWMTGTSLDDAALGSGIGLWAEPTSK